VQNKRHGGLKLLNKCSTSAYRTILIVTQKCHSISYGAVLMVMSRSESQRTHFELHA